MVIQLSVLFDLTVCKHWNHMIPRPMFDHSCLLQKEINKVKIFPQLGSQSDPVSGNIYKPKLKKKRRQTTQNLTNIEKARKAISMI